MSDDDKLAHIIGMLNTQTQILEDARKAMEASVRSVTTQMPFDHLEQHDLLRTHLAMSPPPKEHGEHHEFTEGMKKNVSTVIEVIVKSVGYLIVGAFMLGAATWVTNQNPHLLKPSAAQVGGK